MASGGQITGTQAFLAALGGMPLKEPLVDNTPLGDFWARKGQYISAGQSLTLAITLPRNPSFFFATTDNGAVVYATSADRALWSPSQIVLRATTSTTVDLLAG